MGVLRLALVTTDVRKKIAPGFCWVCGVPKFGPEKIDDGSGGGEWGVEGGGVFVCVWGGGGQLAIAAISGAR